MTEFIGSRISLISKRDIRYVGTLHEINSENSTVALERVVSYGTEGRRPDDEVPPSLDNVYEYIVFRGSDVKDLRIEEGPKDGAPAKPKVPDDPAILGTQNTAKSQPGQGQAQGQGPNNQGAPPQSGPNQQGGPPGHPSQHQQPPPGGFPPYGFNPNQRFGGPQGFPPGPGPYGMPPGPYGAPPGWYPPHGFPPQMPPGGFPPHQMPMGVPGQPGRGPMPPPQGPGVPTPTGSTGPAEGQQQFPKPGDKATAKVPGSNTPIPLQEAPSGPSPGVSKPEGKADASAQGKAPPTGPKGNRIVPAVPLSKGGAPANGAAGVGKPTEDANRDARAAVAAAMAKLPGGQGQKAAGDDAMDNLSKKVSEMRTTENARTSRQPGTGGYAAGNRGTRGGHRGGRNQNQGQKVEIPTTDYDFASANAKFNKQDLVKEAIASGSPVGTPGDETFEEASNGGGRKLSADAGQGSYNKTTSFFDDISSEIKDRVESQESGQRLGGREFRNEERQKNMETFGQGSVDNGYRYRGRGRGRGGRGGFNRGRGGGGGGGGRGGNRGRGGAAFADA